MTAPNDSEQTPHEAPPESAIDTDYDIGQDNIEGTLGPFGFDLHNPVFPISALTVIAFVVFTLLFPELAGTTFSAVFSFVTKGFDWFFIGAADIFVILCLVIVISPYGKIRLGGPEAKPDFTYTSWFAMLFAAGMGIGLMFYGVSEPLSHFSSSLGAELVGESCIR